MRRLPFLPELALIVVLAVMPLVAPLVGASYDLMERVLDWGLLGLGFDLLFGWTGLLSFGQAAFYRHRRLRRRLAAGEPHHRQRLDCAVRWAPWRQGCSGCWSATWRCGASASISP